MPPDAPFLICVAGNPEGFPGFSTFWRTATQVGIDMADCIVVDTTNPLPDLRAFGATSALCLGTQPFRALTGIRLPVESPRHSARGYLFDPSDCLPVACRTREQVGLYKTTRKKDGAILHTLGEAKFAMVTRMIQVPLSPALRWIIPTLDPRAVEVSRFKKLPALKSDLQRLLRSRDASFTPLNISYVERPFTTPGGDRTIAFDIETYGFDGPIERIGVSTSAGTWTAPWTSATKAIFQAMIEDASTLIGHNLAFDIPRLAAAGIQFPDAQLFDTMLAAHMIQPDLYKGLDKVAPLYLDLRAWKHRAAENPARYNAIDVAVTLHLAIRMMSILESTGMAPLFLNTLMPTLRVLMNMTRRGLRVDRIFLGEWQHQLGETYDAHLLDWQRLVGPVNPDSPLQIRQLLYDKLGLPTQWERTKDGMKVTTDAAALRAIRHGAPEIIDLLLSMKHVSKLRSVYAEVAIGPSGCVHPGYLPPSKDTDAGAAASGRLASSNPNIQNQPDEARRLYIPHEEDWFFIEADYSQIELRIAAARARDAALISALQEGDVHAVTMELVGCDRTRAKNLLYGSLYGAGPRKLATVLRQHGQTISESEASDLQSRLASAYAGLWSWRTRVIADGTQLGYLVNAFGRRRYFYHRWRDHEGIMRSGDVPEMLAFLPSSDAADILWNRLSPLELFAEEWNGHLITTVHDSFLLEFPPDSINTSLFHSLRNVLECPFPQIAPDFRVPINIKMGRNWGEMKELA